MVRQTTVLRAAVYYLLFFIAYEAMTHSGRIFSPAVYGNRAAGFYDFLVYAFVVAIISEIAIFFIRKNTRLNTWLKKED